jgi:hypothetical protein
MWSIAPAMPHGAAETEAEADEPECSTLEYASMRL